MARTGGLSGNGSGDIFIAFSTANPDAFKGEGLASLQMVSNEEISPIFDATALGHRGGDHQRDGGRGRRWLAPMAGASSACPTIACARR